MAKDRVSEVLGGKKKSKGKKSAKKKAPKQVKGMHVRKAANGGFISKHDAPEGEEGEEHALQDMAALQAHMQDHMGGEEPAGGVPSPAAAATPAGV